LPREEKKIRQQMDYNFKVEDYLWSKLPLQEQGRIMHLFLNTAPSTVGSLATTEIIYLLQWTFEQRRIRVNAATLGDGYIDLSMTNRSTGESEFVRLYLAGKEIPVTALYDLLNTLEGRKYKRVRFWTFGSFPPAQRSLQDEYPLLVEERDGPALTIWFREAQEYYHRKPAHDTGTQRQTRKPASLWDRLKSFFKQ